ncbi:MAG: hypothetical protein DRQ88_02470 [Epsilonproteobacteria bacterium]|nr:MAG: hypothetical protein DRQ89_02385 [Campylobacterota bacterium]RLA67533.1 MAG: hypothetical protein DRQ88_02470 [Campylobacterota bacterium]
MGVVERKQDNPLIVDVLGLMTPSEIEQLSYIYHSLNRISLTHLMQERLAQEMVEMGHRDEVIPPPLFEQKKWERENPIPAIITKEETKGGPGFILAERERLKKSNQKLGQMKVLSIYQEIAALASIQENSEIKNLGVLINKLSA